MTELTMKNNLSERANERINVALSPEQAFRWSSAMKVRSETTEIGELISLAHAHYNQAFDDSCNQGFLLATVQMLGRALSYATRARDLAAKYYAGTSGPTDPQMGAFNDWFVQFISALRIREAQATMAYLDEQDFELRATFLERDAALTEKCKNMAKAAAAASDLLWDAGRADEGKARVGACEASIRALLDRGVDDGIDEGQIALYDSANLIVAGGEVLFNPNASFSEAERLPKAAADALGRLPEKTPTPDLKEEDDSASDGDKDADLPPDDAVRGDDGSAGPPTAPDPDGGSVPGVGDSAEGSGKVEGGADGGGLTAGDAACITEAQEKMARLDEQDPENRKLVDPLEGERAARMDENQPEAEDTRRLSEKLREMRGEKRRLREGASPEAPVDTIGPVGDQKAAPPPLGSEEDPTMQPDPERPQDRIVRDPDGVY
jgi:hypothetical protein